MYHDKNSDTRIRARKNLFIGCFVLVAMAAIAIGDTGETPMMTAANENIGQTDVSVSGSEDTLGQVESDLQPRENISLDKTIQSITFKNDMQIREALRVLATKYRKNIVPSSKVDGPLTVTTLYDVTFAEALDAILGYGFKHSQEGNFIKVYTAEEYKKIKEDKDRMIYKVFTLYYISAAEVRKLVSPFLSSSGKIEATTAAQTGVPTSETISAQTGGGDTTAMNDTLIIYDYPENIAKAEEVVTLVDIRPKQVLVEATILSATLTEDMQFGIDWQTLKGTAITALTGITVDSPAYLESAGTSTVVESALTGGLTVGFAHEDVAAFIKAVEVVTDVTVLANPKILTVNKQLGQVYIGKKYGYREGDRYIEGGVTEEGQVQFLDTGTKLSFRPYIGDDGYIRMDIHPKDSSGSVPSGIPQETSAELVTNIIVKDGQTIVIGGLFRDKTTIAKTQVPLLGDLPIVGALFRGTADKVERQEVIVLLTPHIIEEPGQTDSESRVADFGRKRIGAKNELEWVSRSRLAEDRYAKAAKYYLEGKNKAAMRELDSVLTLRPTYLEAIRLKEKIIAEKDPEAEKKIERKIIETVEQQDLEKWLRR